MEVPHTIRKYNVPWHTGRLAKRHSNAKINGALWKDYMGLIQREAPSRLQPLNSA